MPTGNPTTDKTFCQITAGEIEVAEDPAQLTGSVKPGDRFIVSVDNLLVNIEHRSAMGVLA